jgi:hypothetical protein
MNIYFLASENAGKIVDFSFIIPLAVQPRINVRYTRLFGKKGQHF